MKGGVVAEGDAGAERAGRLLDVADGDEIVAGDADAEAARGLPEEGNVAGGGADAARAVHPEQLSRETGEQALREREGEAEEVVRSALGPHGEMVVGEA